jgi:hypothetical protein
MEALNEVTFTEWGASRGDSNVAEFVAQCLTYESRAYRRYISGPVIFKAGIAFRGDAVCRIVRDGSKARKLDWGKPHVGLAAEVGNGGNHRRSFGGRFAVLPAQSGRSRNPPRTEFSRET